MDGTLEIGRYCSIGGGVQIPLGGNHRPDWVTTYPFNVLWPEAQGITGHLATRGPVIIGNDVWIGGQAVILSGVKIGDGAVIGTRAIVTRAVPPYAVVAGNPAQELRKRFTESQITALLQIAWWNWPEDRVRAAVPYLLSENVTDFISHALAYEHQSISDCSDPEPRQLGN